MTVSALDSLVQIQEDTLPVTEQVIIARLIDAAEAAGIQADPASIINLYVSLKSKPLAILVGPAQRGKAEVVQCLSQVLTAGTPFQCQFISGHARWAGKSGNVAFFTEAHTRLIAAKLLALIEEAWQPENKNRLFLACLTHISPGELIGFFSELASQLQRGWITQLPTAYLEKPVRYPPNLLLIGTMDTDQFNWLDADLLSNTTVIQWVEKEVAVATDYDTGKHFLAGAEREFLVALVRQEEEACQKLHQVLRGQQTALQPLFLIEQVLKECNIALPRSAVSEVLIYLANAWSKEGVGLFNRNVKHNLALATDLAVAQMLLPTVHESLQKSAAARMRLQAVLKPFPRSSAFLASLG